MRNWSRACAGLAVLLVLPWGDRAPPEWSHASPHKPVEAPQESLATSLGLAVYPSREPGTPQQLEDQGECYTLAHAQTGVDPLGIGMEEPDPADVAQGQTEAQGRVAKGVGAGALLGLSVGRAWRGTGKRGVVSGSAVARSPAARAPIGGGGVVGGTAGVLIGGSKEQGAQNREESEAETEAQHGTEMRNLFERTFSACLESRGYTVK